MDFIDLYAWIQSVPVDALPDSMSHPDGKILNTGRWLMAVQADAASGPTGPRAKTGALQQDMMRIYQCLNET